MGRKEILYVFNDEPAGWELDAEAWEVISKLGVKRAMQLLFMKSGEGVVL